MVETDLSYIIWEEFKKAVDGANPDENSEAFSLSKRVFSISLSELLEFPEINDLPYKVLLNALKLISIRKDLKKAFEKIHLLDQAFIFLISEVPKYKETFISSYLNSILNLSISIDTIEEIFYFSKSLSYLKDNGADINDILNSLSNKYISLMWELIASVHTNSLNKVLDIEKIITYIIKAEGLNLDKESLINATMDILVQYIEVEIDYFGMREITEEEASAINYSGLNKLLELSKHLRPCSERY